MDADHHMGLPNIRRVAVPITVDGDGIGRAISAELVNLGFQPELFQADGPLPQNCDAFFLFGPFGKLLPLPQQFAHLSPQQRPLFIYWNTEGLPDPRLPWAVVNAASQLRSWLGRFSHSATQWQRHVSAARLYTLLEPRLLRFRYLGDYLYAQRMGWVDVFADISAVYAAYLRAHGIPAIAAPFGSFPEWYADLGLERDIDVLWMGKRATKRRSQALDQLRLELRSHGVELYMVDNVEHPFVFHHDRTELLNRAKITLNLLRTWYDENSLRIALAAPNRSLIVSEPLLPHVPQYQPGVHYVSAPLTDLALTILRYLEDAGERRRIVENAYALTTGMLTFRNSIRAIMDAAEIAFIEKGHIPHPASRSWQVPESALAADAGSLRQKGTG